MSNRPTTTEFSPCPQPQFCGVTRHRINSAAYTRCQRTFGSRAALNIGIPESQIIEAQKNAQVLKHFNKAMAGKEHMLLVNDYKRKVLERDKLKEKLDAMKAGGKTPEYYALADKVFEAKMQVLAAQKKMDDNLNKHLLRCVTEMSARGESADDKLKWFVGEVPGAEIEESGPVGSVQWLKHRQTGFGGSDASTVILGGKRDREGLIASKLSEITEGQEFFPDRAEDITAIHRGNMLESMNAIEFQAQNPGLSLRRDKRTWRKPDEPHMIANLDGLIFDGDSPVGVWESKTTNNWQNWEHGIPVEVQCQLDHQMYVTGTEVAYCTVRTNGNQMKTFVRTWGEPIKEPNPESEDEGTMYTDHIDSFSGDWDVVASGEAPEVSSKPRRWKPKINDSTTDAMRGIFGDDLADDYLSSPYEDEDGNEVKVPDSQRFDDLMSTGSVPEDRVFVVVDTETTGFDRSGNEVIEVGMVKMNGKGEVLGEFSELYSPDKRFSDMRGTGAEDVHGITMDDVRGKPNFRSDAASQERYADFIKDADALVGHNIRAFDSQMLDHSSERVRSAHEGKRIVDTMVLARYFDHDTEDNTLKGLSESVGVGYQDGHRAINDARMNAQALMGWFNKHGIKH